MLDAPLRTIAWCQLQAQTDRGEDARKNLSLSKSVCVLHICGVVSCSSSFLSELASFWVFRTYLHGIGKNKNVCKYMYRCHSSRISGCSAWATRKCTHSYTGKMYTHLSDIGQIMYTQFRNCTGPMYTHLYWSALSRLSKCMHAQLSNFSESRHGDVASPL